MPGRAGKPADMTSVAQHAEAHLEFIRRTMERSATFTAVPGLGGAGMGVVGAIESKHGQKPDQSKIQREGNAYLDREHPGLDTITKAEVLP